GTGATTSDLGGTDAALGLAVQSDGDIVVGGYGDKGVGDFDFAVARYRGDNGHADTSFNGTGNALTGLGSTLRLGGSIIVQSDGRIVVAGSSFAAGTKDFALARYDGSNGHLDVSFNGGGTVLTDFGGDDDVANALALDSSGRIIAAGSSFGAAD